jgi:hypothetical protein
MSRCSNAADPFKNYQAAARRRGLSLCDDRYKKPSSRGFTLYVSGTRPGAFNAFDGKCFKHFDDIVGVVAAIESLPCVDGISKLEHLQSEAAICSATVKQVGSHFIVIDAAGAATVCRDLSEAQNRVADLSLIRELRKP